MEKQDLVSIIIPTYNRGYILSRAIESVLNQTYQNTEIIIVDDCSTDNTEEIVKKFSDSRIQYISHSKNRGASAARNTGIKTAKGDFIAFLDSDDEYLPGKIEKSLAVFKKAPESTGMVCSNYYWSRNKGKKIAFLKFSLKNAMRKWAFPPSSSSVVRRKVFLKIGFFDEELEASNDKDFTIRLCQKFSFHFIEEPLVTMYTTEGSLSHNDDIGLRIRIRKKFLEKRAKDSPKSRSLLALYFCSLGKDCLCFGQIREARKYFLKAFIFYPVKVEYFVRFLSTYFGKKIKKRGGKTRGII
jgi:glycosyltransferase involved in cell wall biosynthesis